MRTSRRGIKLPRTATMTSVARRGQPCPMEFRGMFERNPPARLYWDTDRVAGTETTHVKASQSVHRTRARTMFVLLLFSWIAAPSVRSQTPPPGAGAVQGEDTSTNRLVFKKRPRRVYDAAVNIQQPTADVQVPQHKESSVRDSSLETTGPIRMGKREDAFDIRSMNEMPPPETRKDKRDKKDKKAEENWLLVPGSPLADVLESLGSAEGNKDDADEKSESWGWLADEVIARDPRSVLGNRKDKRPVAAAKTETENDEEKTGQEEMPASTMDRDQERRATMFDTPREAAERRDGRDKEKDGRERSLGFDGTRSAPDQSRGGSFERTRLPNDRKESDQENRDRNQAAYDDPQRGQRAAAAEPAQDASAEKSAFPMIQSLLTDLRPKTKQETGTAAKSDYSLKAPAPAPEEAASASWSALGPRTDGAASAPLGRPVLGNMDTSGKIGGLFSPAQPVSEYDVGRTPPAASPWSLPSPAASAAARPYTTPQWPSTVNRDNLWTPASASAARWPGLGTDRTRPSVPNNSTLPVGTPYTRSGSGLSGGLPK